MEDYSKRETTLRDLLRVIFRHKFVIIIVFATIMVSIYIGLELRETPLYESEVKILVTGKMQKDVEVERGLGPGSLIDTQMRLVKSRPILERTIKALKLYQRPLDEERKHATRLKAFLIDRKVKKLKLELEKMTPKQRHAFLFRRAMQKLQERVFTVPIETTSIFLIFVRDYNPVTAAIIANVISRSYVIFDLEQQIAELQLVYGRKNSTIIKLKKHIEKLKESLDGRQLPDIEALGPSSVKIIGQASMGKKLQVKPTKSSAFIIGFIMSIVSGIVLAFGFDFFDQSFKSPQDVETYLNIPLLGSIPKRRHKSELVIGHTNPVTKFTQSFQNLSDQMYLLSKDKNIKSILVIGAEGADEIATIIANLGIYLANRAGNRVLIIDANLRRSSTISKLFNISAATGLADILEKKMPFENAVQDLGSNLNVLCAGETESNPIALLESPIISDVIKEAKEKYEIILINCADLKNFTDAIILASVTDGTILVVNEGGIRRQIIKEAIDPFKYKNINIIGAILNNRRYVIPEIIYKIT